jgi:hypothetical protein
VELRLRPVVWNLDRIEPTRKIITRARSASLRGSLSGAACFTRRPFHFSRASYNSHHPRGAGLRPVSHQVVSEHGVPWRTAGSRRCIRCRIPTFSAEHASLLTSTTTFSVALHRTWFSSLALTCLLGSTFCPHLHIKR